jgi:hypothetical protein
MPDGSFLLTGLFLAYSYRLRVVLEYSHLLHDELQLVRLSVSMGELGKLEIELFPNRHGTSLFISLIMGSPIPRGSFDVHLPTSAS